MFRRLAMWLALLLCAVAPMSAQLYPPINSPVFSAVDANGDPLAGGKLYTYVAGSSTPLSTYIDAAGLTPQTNPVLLDSAGRATIFLGPFSYKFVLKDANDVQQWTVDNVSGQPLTAPVSSVFGRTGSVLAQTGDYTCGQITGALCGLPTIYYQNVQQMSTPFPQRAWLNFSTRFTLSDDSGNSRTTIDLPTTGTENKLVTSASAGPNGNCANWNTNGGLSDSGVSCSFITSWTFNTCTNGTGQPSRCTGTMYLPIDMPDDNYQVVCTVNSGSSEPSDQVLSLHQSPMPTVAFSPINYSMVQVMQNGTSGGQTFQANCIARHN